MLNKRSIQFIAFLQATGLVIYLILISLFFIFITPKFNNSNEQFYAPILMLLLFVISAVISALLFLGKSAVLFWDKKYKESFTLIGWTVGWGVVYFLLFSLALSVK